MSPLAQGQTVVDTPATVVELGLTVAGDVASFGTAQRDSLTESLKRTLNCHEPRCFITLYVSSGSVRVTARLIIPDAVASVPGSAATAATTVAAVQAAANVLVTQPIDAISASLGVVVETAAPVTVTQATVPLAVAPPPPSPPPPSPSLPPLAPPSESPLPAAPPASPPFVTFGSASAPPQTPPALVKGPASEQNTGPGAQTDSNVMTIALAGGLGGLAVIALVVVGAICMRRRGKSDGSASAKAAMVHIQVHDQVNEPDDQKETTTKQMIKTTSHSSLRDDSSYSAEQVSAMDDEQQLAAAIAASVEPTVRMPSFRDEELSALSSTANSQMVHTHGEFASGLADDGEVTHV